jgi:hypothetical protein
MGGLWELMGDKSGRLVGWRWWVVWLTEGEGRCGGRVDGDTRRMGVRWIVGLD